MFVFSFFFLLSLMSILIFSKKKLVMLLLLEMMMILYIFLSYFNFSNMTFSFFLIFTISIFMVLDSVFNFSILISSTRNSSSYNSIITTF